MNFNRLMEYLSVTTRYAIRNLTRNHRRTLLSVAGITIGCSIALVNISMTRGKTDMYIRNAAEGGIGHVRVVPENWTVSHDPGLRLREWQRIARGFRCCCSHPPCPDTGDAGCGHTGQRRDDDGS